MNTIAGVTDFSDKNYDALRDAAESDYSPGGKEYEEKKVQYKERVGYKIARGFDKSPEFRRLNKSFYQRLYRIDNTFAAGRAEAALNGDLSFVKNFTNRTNGPVTYWTIGKSEALAAWDESQTKRTFGVVKLDVGPPKVYRTRMQFNLALAKANARAARLQKAQSTSDSPYFEVLEADDGFNTYIFLNLTS